MDEEAPESLVELTADIVAAYVSKNAIAPADLPALIAATHAALAGASKPAQPDAPTLIPAVPIKKSVTPEFLISLEDGKKYKSLRRHLSTKGMTPDEYKAKWSLPKDYPMVAASYSAQRSSLAKSLGLGRKAAPVATPPAAGKTAKPAPAKRGSKPKVA
jgi:predicted transcriptional regulator